MAVIATEIDLPGGRFQLLRAGLRPSSDPMPPLAILLHGFPDHPPNFAALAGSLADAGFEVAAPWLRGYAPSTTTGPYDVDRLVADVLELATGLHRDRFALIGHDWGAVITYATCAAAPERVTAAVAIAVPHQRAFLRSLFASLQLLRSWYILFFQMPGAGAAVRAREFALVDWLWRNWSPGFELDADARRALHACLAESMPAPIAYYRALVRPVRAAIARLAPSSTLMRPIQTPLLHLHGSDDRCIGASTSRGERRYFHGPFAREIIPGAGHFLHLEAPETIAPLISSWLIEHGSQA
jgi:pimeloyl-ACP methyl ester carboxylesterase